MAEAQEAVARGLTRSDALSEAHQALGDDADIVARFAAQPSLRAWSARRPALCFLTLPAATFLLLAAALMAAMLGAMEHWPALHRMTVPAEVTRGVNLAVQIAFLGVLPVAVCAVFALLAHRQRLALRWPVLGSFLLCLLVSMINVGFEVTGGEQPGMASAGIGTSLDVIGRQLVHALGLALVVIAPLCFAQRRAWRSRIRSR